MEKYMGNKSKLLDFIYENVEKERLSNEVTIFDAFAGTTNVGKYFKEKNYNVICNDINDFTFALSKCYISNVIIPEFKGIAEGVNYSAKNFKKVTKTDSFKKRIEKLLKENQNMLSDDFKNTIITSTYLKILVYLTYYSSPGDYDNSFDNGIRKPEMYDFLQRNYTEYGDNAKYINLVYKKTLNNLLKRTKDDELKKLITNFYKQIDDESLLKLKNYIAKIQICDLKEHDKILNILNKVNIIGNRKFFSIEHAKKLDIILNTICYWFNNKFILENEFYVLMTSVLETITIFSNTSATYQAFYKEYKANTMQAFRLIVPQLIINNKKYSSMQGDVFENINEQKYDILYIDPPYNWRQYDSNYHLLNTVAKINSINIIDFEKDIVGASGENRIKKLKYTSFNQTESFEKRLIDLIELANCSMLLLSYSDSNTNHRVDKIDDTLSHIEDFLKNEDIFLPNSYKKIEFSRQNFESRKSNQKQEINEILFIARKR